MSAAGFTVVPALYWPVEALLLSTRPANCLAAADIRYVGELVRNTQDDLLSIKNLGRESLIEIERVLARNGLRLGTTLFGYPCRDALDASWAALRRGAVGSIEP